MMNLATMDNIVYREYVPDLEVRSAAQGGDGRTVHGIAVPFDRPTPIEPGLTEEFDRAAFDHQMRAITRVPFYHGHRVHGGKHVGHQTMGRADAAGLYGEWYVDKTRDGDDALEMIRSGSLPHLSVGFVLPAAGSQTRGQVTRRMKAHLTEVAAVPNGAYGEDAPIQGVRAHLLGGFGDVCPTCGQSGGVEPDRVELAREVLQGLPVLPSI